MLTSFNFDDTGIQEIIKSVLKTDDVELFNEVICFGFKSTTLLKKNDYYIFRLACYYGSFQIVKFILEIYPETDIHCGSESAFIEACGQNHYKLVQYLLDKYPSIDIGAQESLALRAAAWNGSKDTLKILLHEYKLRKYSVLPKTGTEFFRTFIASILQRNISIGDRCNESVTVALTRGHMEAALQLCDVDECKSLFGNFNYIYEKTKENPDIRTTITALKMSLCEY